MPHPEDAALIARMLSDHGAALEVYAAQWTETAEDCVQEALLDLASLPAQPANPRAWLYRAVRNRALNMARSANRRATHEQLAARLQAKGITRVDVVEITDAIAALPDEVREAVVLRIWGKLTWEELGDVTGRSSTTMQRRYIDGLRALQKIWGIEPCRSKTDCRTS